MSKKINKIIIEVGNTQYEFTGGGGSDGHAPADSVDSQAIIDGAVHEEDLSDEVKDKMRKTYVEDDEALHMDYDEMDVNNSQTQEAGAGEDEVSGDGPSLDDLDDLPGGGFNDPMTEEEGD